MPYAGSTAGQEGNKPGSTDLEEMKVGCLLQAGHQALVVTHLCHHLSPLLDQGTAPAYASLN